MPSAPHAQSEAIEHRIELALRMIDLGAWVFPLAHDSKLPLIPKAKGGHGFQDAAPDKDRARTFLSNPGEPNYGVVFPDGSDVIVLDLDGGGDPPRPSWREDWQHLYEQYGPPGLTFLVRTPSGGRHAYYRWPGVIPPGDEMLGWTVRKPWKGYLVGPGSVVNGRLYESVGIDTIVELADAWVKAALEHRPAGRVVHVGPRMPTQVAKGSRHAFLRDRAWQFAHVGLGGEALFDAVMSLNRELAEPKTADEVRRAIGEAEEQAGEPEPVFTDAARQRRSHSEPADLDLPFYPASAISSLTDSDIEWAWNGYVGFGTVVELVGAPKAGKTTLVFGLIRAYLDGEPFMERATGGGPVVVLTEQGATSLRAVLERSGLAERADVEFLLYRDARGEDWPSVVHTARRRCRELGSRLLVVDTLPVFAGLSGDLENNAGDALEAMEPILGASNDGLAVLLIRHRRKGPAGDIADEGRGSGAFSGTVDVILALRRRSGGGRPTLRTIIAASRFDETPEVLDVELVGDEYVVVDSLAVELEEAREDIAERLSAQTPAGSDEQTGRQSAQTPAGLSRRQLEEATGRSRATIQRALEGLMGEGRVSRAREKGRGSGFIYRLEGHGIAFAHSPPPLGGGEVNGERSNPLSRAPSPGTSVHIDCHDVVAHASSHRDVLTDEPWCAICSPKEEI